MAAAVAARVAAVAGTVAAPGTEVPAEAGAAAFTIAAAGAAAVGGWVLLLPPQAMMPAEAADRVAAPLRNILRGTDRPYVRCRKFTPLDSIAASFASERDSPSTRPPASLRG